MEGSISSKVYDNIYRMMKYRNIEPKVPKLSSAEVLQKLVHYEYITIDGTRTLIDGTKVPIVIILIYAGSKFAGRVAEVQKLLKPVPKDTAELMFVSEKGLSNHIKRAFVEIKKARKNMYIEDHSYIPFCNTVPEHVSVPKHVIATEEEVDIYCAKYRKRREHFGKIFAATDAAAIWIGIKPKQTAKIYRASEMSGELCIFRYCS